MIHWGFLKSTKTIIHAIIKESTDKKLCKILKWFTTDGTVILTASCQIMTSILKSIGCEIYVHLLFFSSRTCRCYCSHYGVYRRPAGGAAECLPPRPTTKPRAHSHAHAARETSGLWRILSLHHCQPSEGTTNRLHAQATQDTIMYRSCQNVDACQTVTACMSLCENKTFLYSWQELHNQLELNNWFKHCRL